MSPDEANITKRWMKSINDQLQQDRFIARKLRRTQEHTDLINNTWSKIITPNINLLKNWVTSPEVLVGIKLPRPPQTEVT
jgi:hypothetical protein